MPLFFLLAGWSAASSLSLCRGARTFPARATASLGVPLARLRAAPPPSSTSSCEACHDRPHGLPHPPPSTGFHPMLHPARLPVAEPFHESSSRSCPTFFLAARALHEVPPLVHRLPADRSRWHSCRLFVWLAGAPRPRGPARARGGSRATCSACGDSVDQCASVARHLTTCTNDWANVPRTQCVPAERLLFWHSIPRPMDAVRARGSVSLTLGGVARECCARSIAGLLLTRGFSSGNGPSRLELRDRDPRHRRVAISPPPRRRSRTTAVRRYRSMCSTMRPSCCPATGLTACRSSSDEFVCSFSLRWRSP
jgi:hypothetical protein